MKIKQPQIKHEKGEICLYSEIETDADLDIPKFLWFRVPEKDQDKISCTANPFLTALFVVAMKYNEDIEVEGKVSPQLLKNINEYQEIYNTWFPEFKIIKIKCHEFEPVPETSGAVVCSFSGGVDSTYTLWTNMPQNQPDPKKQLTHGLFIHGIDINIEDHEAFLGVKKTHTELFQNLGLDLLTIRTNVKWFIYGQVKFEMGVGGAVLGTAMVFAPFISVYYFNSTFDYNQLFPAGSHPKTDPLLTTENREVIHYGCDKNRVEKILAFADWPVTYHSFRTCNQKDDNRKINCCRCTKCVRVMIILAVAGKLDRYNTFPKSLTRKDVRNNIIISRYQQYYIRDIYQYTKRHGTEQMAKDVKWSMIKSSIPATLVRILYPYRLGRKIFGWRRLIEGVAKIHKI